MDLVAAALAFFGKKKQASGNGTNGGSEDAGPKSTILVIDDDSSFLETMRILLSGAGYNVLTSTTGPKGLDMVRYAPRVKAVLLDFNMPGFNGAETLQYLRKLNPSLKVIAVSGLKASELPPAFQKSVTRFMAKPFSNGELLETVAELTGNPSAAGVSATA